jgi:hypothetical protein
VKKPTALAALTGATALGLAASLAIQLANHHVGIAAIMSTVLSTLAVGLMLAIRFDDASRTVLYTCPAKGCDASIRAKDTSPAELDRLRSYATDHSKHGGAR